MLLKLGVIALLILIIYSLGSGLFFLVRESQDSARLVKALTWRIVLSFCLFVLLIIAYAMGWIAPHGILPA